MTVSLEFELQAKWSLVFTPVYLALLRPQIREQMSGPDLHVFAIKFLALKKLGFPP